MAVLKRVLVLAVYLVCLAGCVYEGKCVQEGARRGPDGRCAVEVLDAGSGGVDASSRDAGAQDAGNQDSGASDAGMCSVDQFVAGRANQCTSASDVDALGQMYGEMGDQTIRDIAFSCGGECAFDSDPESCVASCVLERTSEALSAGCAACYGAAVDCATEHCIGPCAADAGSPECIRCFCGMDGCADCSDVLDTCGGVMSTICDDVPPRECEEPVEPYPADLGARCGMDTRDCLIGCSGAGDCLQTCLMNDGTPSTTLEGRDVDCIGCINLAQIYCIDTMGCHAELSAWRCCVQEVGCMGDCPECASQMMAANECVATTSCGDFSAAVYDSCFP